MKRLLLALGLTFVTLLGFAGPATAASDYGSGYFTYTEWLNLYGGEARSTVADHCNCTGTVINYAAGYLNVFYDNTLTNGFVLVVYRKDAAGAWRTRLDTQWCDSTGTNCNVQYY